MGNWTRWNAGRTARRIMAGTDAEADVIRIPGEDIEICICKYVGAGGDLDEFIREIRRQHDLLESLAQDVVNALVRIGIMAEPALDPAEVYTSSERPGKPIVIERSVWVNEDTDMSQVGNCLNGLGLEIKGDL